MDDNTASHNGVSPSQEQRTSIVNYIYSCIVSDIAELATQVTCLTPMGKVYQLFSSLCIYLYIPHG